MEDRSNLTTGRTSDLINSIARDIALSEAPPLLFLVGASEAHADALKSSILSALRQEGFALEPVSRSCWKVLERGGTEALHELHFCGIEIAVARALGAEATASWYVDHYAQERYPELVGRLLHLLRVERLSGSLPWPPAQKPAV